MFDFLGQVSVWVFLFAIILLITISLKGKLSPVSTIILIGGLFLLYSLYSLPTYLGKQKIIDKTIPPLIDQKIPKDKIVSKEETIGPKRKNETEKRGFDSLEIKEGNSPKEKSLVNPIEPKAYAVSDEKLWTYQTDGFWDWDFSFVEAIEKQTGWRKMKSGNYEIDITQSGTFSQKLVGNEMKYVYSGGMIQFSVNGRQCCCENLLLVEEDISYKKLATAKMKLQEITTRIILKNEDEIIRQIKNCFMKGY